jgi:hypothetical protein
LLWQIAHIFSQVFCAGKKISYICTMMGSLQFSIVSRYCKLLLKNSFWDYDYGWAYCARLFFCPFVCFVSVQTSSGRGGKFVYFCWKKAAVVAAKT